MSAAAPEPRGKLQRAILELLARTEVVQREPIGDVLKVGLKQAGLRPTQYECLSHVIRELHRSLNLGPREVDSPEYWRDDYQEAPPHAFDVAVRRALRTLESRGMIRMARARAIDP